MVTTVPGESFNLDSDCYSPRSVVISTTSPLIPEPTWADWRADERRRRVRRYCRFHRSQKTRCQCPQTGASQIEASPPQPGFPYAPLREVPAPFPLRIPKVSEKTRGKEEDRGAWLPDEIPLWSPPPFLTPQPQVISHNCRSFGEETKAPSADGSVYPDPRCRWRKSLVGSTVPASSKLPLASPPSFVRHFLETALFFCTYKSKPSAQPRHPHPVCSIKKWMGINNMAPRHKTWQWFCPSRSGITKKSTGHGNFPNISIELLINRSIKHDSVVFIILSCLQLLYKVRTPQLLVVN